MLFRSGNTVSVTGNVTGGTNNGVLLSGNTTLNITGTVTGGATAGVAVSGTASILNVTGTCVGGTAAGVSVANSASSTGTVTATRAKGGPLASSAVGIGNGLLGSVVTVDEIEYGDVGVSPTAGPIRFANKISNVAIMYRFGTTKKSLVDTASTSLIPAASNVRSGITYNAGQTIGTMAVPSASSVATGVPVDKIGRAHV